MFRCSGVCSQCGKCHRNPQDKEVRDRKKDLLSLPSDFTPEIEEGYGVAFDVGTTTVVGILWDLAHGKIVGSAALTNPQIRYGADVISRIAFSMNEGNLQILQHAIVDCLNTILERLCEAHGIGQSSIVRAVACGNTTMSHLLLGIDPGSLAKAPFTPGYRGVVICRADELDIHIRTDGTITVLPNIAGHIGGDITADLLAVRMEDAASNALLIDIGTNGEIVLYSHGRMQACSTAAGPAFEGASIHQGMRAAKGVIERFRIKDAEIEFHVIGNVPPIGICGSGLIDIVAELLRKGVIDKTGKLLSTREYTDKYGDTFLAERIVEDGQGRRLILVSMERGEDIVLTQKDIREVQLAKAAISAGITILLKKAGLAAKDLERIYLAGAFGSFIDRESAVAIGLLPNVSLEKIIPVGNAASAGALMALTNTAQRTRMQAIPATVEHVDLSAEEGFHKVFLHAMSF